jgi:CheY-like chemotaxis protein/PAS domain-containing protein
MGLNIQNILVILDNMESTILVNYFNDPTAYKSIKKTQYVPYIESLIKNSTFSYREYTSFSLHYYQFSDHYNVCIIGHYSDSLNAAIYDLFNGLKTPDMSTIESNLLHAVLKATPDYVAYKNLDGEFKYVSNKVKELYPSYQTLVGKNIKDIYSPERVDEINYLDQEVYLKKTPVKRQIEIETESGVRFFDSVRTPVFDETMNPLGIISINQGISQDNQTLNQSKQFKVIQEVILDIANSFIDLSTRHINDVIHESLEKLGQSIQADRCYIFKYNFDQNEMQNTYEWCNKGITPEIDSLQHVPIIDYLEDWVMHHRQKENIIIPAISELDHDTALYKLLHMQNIQSLFTMPIFIDNTCYGFIGFDSVIKQRKWEHIPQVLKIVPNLYGNLLSRHEIYEALITANDSNQNASQEMKTLLESVSSQLMNPINELMSLYTKNNQANHSNEAEIYHINIMKSTIDNLFSLTDKSTDKNIHYSEFDLLNLLHLVIHNNKQKSLLKNNTLYMSYDYNLTNYLSSDQQKWSLIMDGMLKYMIDLSSNQTITVFTKTTQTADPYTSLRCGVDISLRQTISKKIPTKLKIVDQLLKQLKSKLQIKGTKSTYTLFFDIVVYSPKRIHTNKQMIPSLYVDLTIASSTNVLDQLKSIYGAVEVFTPSMLSKPSNLSQIKLVFIHTNNPDNYASNITSILEKIPQDATKIVMYDNQPSILYQSLVMIDYLYELPLKTSHLDTLNASYLESNNNDVSTELDADCSIMIIDDNPKVHKLFDDALKNQSIALIHVNTGKDALTLQIKPNTKMIFIDEHMPLMNGYDTAKALLETNESIKSTFILLGAKITIDQSTLFQDVLIKPLTIESIQTLVNKALKGDTEINAHPTTPALFNLSSFKKSYSKQTIRQNILTLYYGDIEKLSNMLNNGFTKKDLYLIKTSCQQLLSISSQLHTDALYQEMNDLLSKIKKDEPIYHLQEHIEQLLKETLIKLKQFMKKRPSY